VYEPDDTVDVTRRRPWHRSLPAFGAALAVLTILGAGVGVAAGLARSPDSGLGTGPSSSPSGSAPPSASPSPVPTVDTSCGAFREDFTGLLTSPWSTENNQFVDKVDTDGNVLILVAKEGADLYPEYQGNPGGLRPPMISRPMTGSFVLQTGLKAEPNFSYQGAGLILYQDTKNYVRLETGAGGKGRAIGFEYQLQGGGHAKVKDPMQGHVPNKWADVELKLVRDGGLVHGFWRPKVAQDWQSLGDAKVQPDADYKVGVLVINRAQPPKPNPNPGPFAAEFDYVEARCGTS
jgi:hypothetical protein